MTTEPNDEDPMRGVRELAAEMAARHQPTEEEVEDFLEECRALGLDPSKERVTPLMYALAIAGSVGSRK